MTSKRQTVFISYSHDNSKHSEWVLKLANDLRANYGIDIILDQFELEAGRDLTYFMESSIEKSDKVLVILTPKYKEKADNRKNGVGYETSIITKEIYDAPITNVKYIPILRVGNSSQAIPTFLSSKIYHNMKNEEDYDKSLQELSDRIYDKPSDKKSALGNIPDYNKKRSDPVLDIANDLLHKESLNREIDNIIQSRQGIELFNSETKKLRRKLHDRVDYYKSNSDIPFYIEENDRDKIIIKALGFSVSFYWHKEYFDSGKGAFLIIRDWIGIYMIKPTLQFESDEPKLQKEEKYSFYLDDKKNVVWRTDDRNYTTSQLIQEAFLFLIENIRKDRV